MKVLFWNTHKNQNIDYYLKKESINNDNFISKLKEFEELMISSSTDTYSTINKSILKLYEESNS